ncbi:MAG TPA: exo-alpha-sialidase [Bacteroidia bacterium]|nr:exo-alpha-sialidase [Bacteroidia bacterium]
MKKIFLLTTIVFTVNIACAQWQADTRLTNDTNFSATSFNGARTMTASGNVLHVIWSEDRDGNREIYCKRSPDQGLSWGADVRLTNNIAGSIFPSVIASSSEVHVVWEEYRDGINGEIYYKRSADGGLTWGTDTRLTFNPANSFSPSAAVSGSVVHVVWFDQRDGNNEIYYKRSPDGGLTWGADTTLTINIAASAFPSVAVSGSEVHVVWEEYRDGNGEMYYKRSTDGGLTWGADTRLTFNAANSFSPSISVSGSLINIAWHDERDANQEIYTKRSPDGGLSWGTDTRVTNDPSVSSYVSVTVSGSNVHVAWIDERDGNTELYYNRSTDGGISWGGDARLTNDSARSTDPAVDVTGSIVHIVWTDARDNFPVYTGNYEIYYKRDSTGNALGVEDVMEDPVQQISIYPNPNNGTFYFSTNKSINSGNIKTTLYNLSGKIIFEKKVNVNDRIKISNTDDGIYFLRITSENYTVMKKFLIVK